MTRGMLHHTLSRLTLVFFVGRSDQINAPVTPQHTVAKPIQNDPSGLALQSRVTLVRENVVRSVRPKDERFKDN
jgi:hypothetical protein